MENKDKLIEEFFKNQKTVIPDNGFSENVMRKLPASGKRELIVGLFALVGFILTILLVVDWNLVGFVINSIKTIPVYYFLVLVFCFPLICLILLWVNKRNNLLNWIS